MRKRLIYMCINVILVCGIYQYAKSEAILLKEASIVDIEDNVEGSSENKTIQHKEVSEETEEVPANNEAQQAEDGKSAEPIYIIQPQFIRDNTYEM